VVKGPGGGYHDPTTRTSVADSGEQEPGPCEYAAAMASPLSFQSIHKKDLSLLSDFIVPCLNWMSTSGPILQGPWIPCSTGIRWAPLWLTIETKEDEVREILSGRSFARPGKSGGPTGIVPSLRPAT
jgi:hypothetical protein